MIQLKFTLLTLKELMDFEWYHNQVVLFRYSGKNLNVHMAETFRILKLN